MSNNAKLGESIDALRAMVALRGSDGWNVLVARSAEIEREIEDEMRDVTRTDATKAEHLRHLLFRYRRDLRPEVVCEELIAKMGSRANNVLKLKPPGQTAA